MIKLVSRIRRSGGGIAVYALPLPLRGNLLAMSASGAVPRLPTEFLFPVTRSAFFLSPLPVVVVWNVSLFCDTIITHFISFVNTFLTNF